MYKFKKYIITTPKGFESLNDEFDDEFLKPFFKENETSISIHELLVRSFLIDNSIPCKAE